MTTPSVGGDKKEKKEEEKKITVGELEKAYKVIFHEGPKAVEEAGLKDEAMAASKSLHGVTEYHKPWLARQNNRFNDTTFGAGFDILAKGAIVVLAGIAIKAGYDGWSEKRKAEGTSSSSETDEFLTEG